MKIIYVKERNNKRCPWEKLLQHMNSFSYDYLNKNQFLITNFDVEWNAAENLIKNRHENIIFLAKDHSCTAKIFEKVQLKNMKIVIFDAHNDYDSNFTTDTITNWNFLNFIKMNIKKGILLGLRHYHPMMKKTSIIDYYHAPDLMNTNLISKRLKEFVANEFIYISIDLDVLDPTYFPDVSDPVPGGLSYNELIYYLRICLLNSKQFIIDISEIRYGENHMKCLRLCKKLLEDIYYYTQK